MIILITTTTVSSSMGAQMRTDWTPTALRPSSSAPTVAVPTRRRRHIHRHSYPSSRPSRVPSRVRRTLSARSGRRRCFSSSISVNSVDTPARRGHPAPLSIPADGSVYGFVERLHPPHDAPPRRTTPTGRRPASSSTRRWPSSSAGAAVIACSPPRRARTCRGPQSRPAPTSQPSLSLPILPPGIFFAALARVSAQLVFLTPPSSRRRCAPRAPFETLCEGPLDEAASEIIVTGRSVGARDTRRRARRAGS